MSLFCGLVKMGPCCICQEAGKYRCVGCRAAYCSVGCCSAHKVLCVRQKEVVAGGANREGLGSTGLLRTARKRPYQQEREEVAYTADPETLSRLLELPSAAAVVELLRSRDRDLRKRLLSSVSHQSSSKEREANEDEGGDGDSEMDGPPEVMTTSPPPPPSPDADAVSKPLLSGGLPSVGLADQVSLMNHLADVVTQVCNAPTLEKKRRLMQGFLSTDAEVDAFCDAILQRIGARDADSHFIL